MPAKKSRKRDDHKRNRPSKEESVKESEQSGENDLIFTLEILRVVEEAQQVHGLRHSDYLRYRTYCSNKIHRLRRLLKLTQTERRHYRKKIVEVKQLSKKGADPKLLQIPLFLSERAWAAAMEMRPSCEENSRKKFHLVRRLRKAVAYAKQLDGLCQSKYCDAQTKLESQAYLEWIRGVLNFELQNWETAAASFKIARIIYENLASTITDLGNRIYKKKADEINHNLRFCHYNLGTDDQFNILQFRKEGILNNLEVLLKQTKMRRKDELRDIEWYGLKMAVRPEKVRTFLFAVQALDQSLDTIDSNSEKIKLFDQILMDCRDAITLAIEDAKLNKHDNSNLEKYLKAIRLRRTIERNTLMMEQGEKSKTVMRLYDIILEQLGELENLLPADTVGYRDELTKIAYFKPVKFYSLAKIMAKQQPDEKKNREDCLQVLDLLEQAEIECYQLPLDIETDPKLNKIFSAIQEQKSIVSAFLEDDDVMLDCSTLNLNEDESDDDDDDFVDAVDDSFV